MRQRGPWAMPQDEAQPLIELIENKIRSSEIEVQRREALIRLRSAVEEQLGIRPPAFVVSIKPEADREFAA